MEHPPLQARIRGAQPLAAAALLALLSGAPALVSATGLSGADTFNAGKARAESDLIADRAACEKLFGNPRDVCRERALGKERVTKAELELAHTGTRQSGDRLTGVQIDTTYDVARTECNDKTGAAKIRCTKQAQAERTRAQAELTHHQRKAAARRSGGAEERRTVDDSQSAQKCDAVPADLRAACAASAKTGGR